MEQNNTGRYLKYAIGEIVLVVVGILIALQINNWNGERLRKIEVRSFLQSMITDLEEDLISFNKTRRNLNKEINNGSRILNSKNYATLPIDSISKLIGPITYRYEGINQTFEKITNSSLAGQLGSKSLTEAINGYYTVSLPSYVFFQRLINERTARDIEFWFENEDYEIAVPYSMDTSKKFPFQEDESIRKVKLLKRIGSNKGRNSLRTNVIRKSTILKELEKLYEETKTLNNLIYEELNKLNQ